MANKAIFMGASWCCQCHAARPLMEEQCRRLNMPLTIKDAEADEAERVALMGEKRDLPYAIVTVDGKTIKGNAFEVIEALKAL